MQYLWKKRMATRLSIIAALMWGCLASQCYGADLDDAQPKVTPIESRSPWFVRLGAGGIYFDSSASLKAAGTPVLGATATADDNYTFLFDVGYYLYDRISVTFTGGYPPTTALTGQGTATALGVVGRTVYGPAALTAQYHFAEFGAFQPYLGGGLAYAIIFNSEDAATKNLSIKGAPGLVLQAGFDIMLDQHWGMYLDVKKLYLQVNATGTLGPAPVTADITLDPLVVSTGITYRF